MNRHTASQLLVFTRGPEHNGSTRARKTPQETTNQGASE